MITAQTLDAYDAARHRAGLIPRTDRARIVVSGKDRASYLHGLLTNDIAALRAGQGCYAAYLTPQGRMIADLWVDELGDVILLTVIRDVKETILAKLDQFIFTEDVQLGDVTDTFPSVAIVGPRAAAIATRVLGEGEGVPSMLAPQGNLRTSFNGQPAIVLRTSDLGEPGFDILVDVGALPLLTEQARHEGALDVDSDAAEILRIESGIPKFHQDMDEETIPLEAGIESRAISLTKGCYVGQEVIIRVLHRGHGRVARKLVGLTVDGKQTPSRGARIEVEAHQIGAVTSAAWSPRLGCPIALAYVQRDFVEPHTRVMVEGCAAEVTALPFIPIRQ